MPLPRREFFKALGLIVGAASAPGLFLPKFEPVRWKVARPTRCVPNPAWVKAPYEIFFYDMPPRFDEHILRDYSHLIGSAGIDCGPNWRPFPCRFESRGGYFVPIPPFISV